MTTIEQVREAWNGMPADERAHAIRAARLAVKFGHHVGMDKRELTALWHGGLLHDIGKSLIPHEILRKPGELDKREKTILRLHPKMGYDLLSGIPALRPSLDVLLCHHERWDGGGYPRGLTGEAIPLMARVFSIADVWDALVTTRPYSPAWNVGDASRHLLSEAGKAFDPKLALMFVSLSPTPTGSLASGPCAKSGPGSYSLRTSILGRGH